MQVPGVDAEGRARRDRRVRAARSPAIPGVARGRRGHRRVPGGRTTRSSPYPPLGPSLSQSRFAPPAGRAGHLPVGRSRRRAAVEHGARRLVKRHPRRCRRRSTSWSRAPRRSSSTPRQSVISRLPLALGMIALATFVLLFLMTGSLLVPIKALVLNMLTLTATFGAIGVDLPGRPPRESAAHHADRQHRRVHTDPDVLHRVRTLDGLRGVPARRASRRSTTSSATTSTPSRSACRRRGGSSPPPRSCSRSCSSASRPRRSRS